MKNTLNKEVTLFLKELNHPLEKEILILRKTILESQFEIKENIKWNAPNYTYKDEDRITMRIHPPKQIQLIFHRGAKVKKQPESKLIKDKSGFLNWKENDRAILTLKDKGEIDKLKKQIQTFVSDWILALNLQDKKSRS